MKQKRMLSAHQILHFLLGLFVKKKTEKDIGFPAEANFCTKIRKNAQICLRNPQTFVSRICTTNFPLETLKTDAN